MIVPNNTLLYSQENIENNNICSFDLTSSNVQLCQFSYYSFETEIPTSQDYLEYAWNEKYSPLSSIDAQNKSPNSIEKSINIPNLIHLFNKISLHAEGTLGDSSDISHYDSLAVKKKHSFQVFTNSFYTKKNIKHRQSLDSSNSSQCPNSMEEKNLKFPLDYCNPITKSHLKINKKMTTEIRTESSDYTPRQYSLPYLKMNLSRINHIQHQARQKDLDDIPVNNGCFSCLADIFSSCRS